MEVLYSQLFTNKGRKVLAIAKNYFEHAIEMGATDIPPIPVIFQKPLTSIINEQSPIRIPQNTEVHHEIELGVMISKEGKNIRESETENYIAGYCLALDLTARNVQAEAKKQGWPWDVGKGYDGFLPLSSFIPRDSVTDPYALELELQINGQTKQKAITGQMHYKIHYLIHYLSGIFTLCPGDILLTGTPAGVGPIRSGDMLNCYLRQSGSILLSSSFSVI